jgi:hypothetical protein
MRKASCVDGRDKKGTEKEPEKIGCSVTRHKKPFTTGKKKTLPDV